MLRISFGLCCFSPKATHDARRSIQREEVSTRKERGYLQRWHWVFITGGCSRRGVQRMGVVLYNKTSVQHHINHYNLFPLHPPLMNLEALPLGERPKRRAPRMLRVSRGNPCHMSIAAIITWQALGLGPVAYELLLPSKVLWLISISNFGGDRSFADDLTERVRGYPGSWNDQVLLCILSAGRCLIHQPVDVIIVACIDEASGVKWRRGLWSRSGKRTHAHMHTRTHAHTHTRTHAHTHAPNPRSYARANPRTHSANTDHRKSASVVSR